MENIVIIDIILVWAIERYKKISVNKLLLNYFKDSIAENLLLWDYLMSIVCSL